MEKAEQALLRIPRVRLASLPTPLERLENLEKELGGGAVYIKRDDLTGLGPGGNKTRSLEYLLGEAAENNCDLVIAAGPVQSNLCTLAAACACRMGMDCLLVHNGDKPDRLEGNLMLNRLLGAESIFLGRVGAEEREEAVAALLLERTRRGRKPYVIRNGATTGRGALGYASAILELDQQCRRQGIERMTVFAPGGNGGVASGLIYGNQLLGGRFSLVIVSVEDETPVLTEHIRRTIAQAEEITGVPMPGSVEESALITDAYRGSGWGVNTPESQRIVTDFARLEGILIENVYTSKVLVGLCDFVRRGRAPGPVCYLHTGGLGSLFSQYK